MWASTLSLCLHSRVLQRLALAKQTIYAKSVSSVPNHKEVSTLNALEAVPKSKSFASLFRNSTFVQVGELRNVELIGKICQVHDEHVYVDFGGKFLCVCNVFAFSKSFHTRSLLKRGTKVIVELQDFELSARFLGATKDTTLLEAGAKLVGLYQPTFKKKMAKDAIGDEKNRTEQDDKILNTTSLKSDVASEITDKISSTDISKDSKA